MALFSDIGFVPGGKERGLCRLVWRIGYARAGARLCSREPAELRNVSSAVPRKSSGDSPVNLTVAIGPLIALIAGILILIVPRLLNYIVAIYLIIIGLLGLFGGRLIH
jgi:hypothetical protein